MMRPPRRFDRKTTATVGVAVLPLVAACSGNSSALDPRGRGAEEIAGLWWLLFALGTAVFVLVMVLLVATAVRGRRRPAGDDGGTTADPATSAHRFVIWGGVVLPLVVLAPLSVVIMRTGARISPSPDAAALAIEVVAHQFWWEVRYPDRAAVTANEIHIPVGRTVELRLASADVIHSFWVPSLHGKVDMIPGEETVLVLDAREPGAYRGQCAEYCGIQHAGMALLVIADEPEEFDRWLEGQAADAVRPATPVAAAGQEAFATVGCASCHTVRGTPAAGDVGPDLTHFGSRRTIGAAVVENNRGNLGGWIANPQGIKPGNLMPPSVLDPEELQGLIAYLEGLE